MLTRLQLFHNKQPYELGPLVHARVPTKIDEQLPRLLSKQAETVVVGWPQLSEAYSIWLQTTQVFGAVRYMTSVRFEEG